MSTGVAMLLSYPVAPARQGGCACSRPSGTSQPTRADEDKSRIGCGSAVADSRAKRNGSSEADLHVPAKLFEQRLERGEEAEALPGRQVVAEDDLLQLGVAERVQVEVPGQVAA